MSHPGGSSQRRRPTFVPPQPCRPDADIAALAARPLGELTTQIAELRRHAECNNTDGRRPGTPIDVSRLQQLEQAARHRLDRLTTELLTDPPGWLHQVVTTDLEHGQLCEPEQYSRFARRVAGWSDTAGRPVRADSIDELLGGPPADPRLIADVQSLATDLAALPEPAAPEVAIDLGL